MSGEIEDGMGFGGLVESKEERKQRAVEEHRDAWRAACRYLYEVIGEGSQNGRPLDDGQLDHANREIERLRIGIRSLSDLCAKRFDMLKQVAGCSLLHLVRDKYEQVLMPVELWDRIVDETDEHEVNP